jgi:hypothetical protein
LKQLQRSLAETTHVPELEILAAVDAHRTSRAGYGLVIRPGVSGRGRLRHLVVASGEPYTSAKCGCST